jgi:hypothetical protein
MRKTKPISGSRDGAGGRGQGLSCETNPIWPSLQAGRGLRGRNVRNKPNLHCQRKTSGEDAQPTKSQRDRTRETNPIWPGGQAGRSLEGEACKTKPISGSPVATGGRIVQREPNLGRASVGPNVRNEPNLHPWAIVSGASPTLQVGSSAPNKPNSAKLAGRPGPRRTKRAKQTQFALPAEEVERGRPTYEDLAGPIVQNEANSRVGSRRGSGSAPVCRPQRYVRCTTRCGKLGTCWMGGTPKRSGPPELAEGLSVSS